MPIRKRVVRMKRRRQRPRRWCGISLKDVLQFLSSLLLPLMLGVFTVVITFQQQKLAQNQRIEDKEEMRLQREQDRNQSRLLREQDQDELRLQREQDKNESRLQREQDRNETRLQREQEWNIAQIAQATQTKANTDRYQNEILIAYIKETSDLLEDKSGSLTTDPLTRTLARVKTLNTIRQLDGDRQTYVLRFLQEARQLINRNNSLALDISTAELRGIDFGRAGHLLSAEEISLAGVYLVNSTLGDGPINNVNFSSARLGNINFSSAKLGNVNFSSAKLDDVNFLSVELFNVNFSSAGLFNVNFSSAGLYGVNFSPSELEDVNFSPSELEDVNFSLSELKAVNFSSAKFDNVNFSSAELYDVNFSSALLDNVNFSSAGLYGVNFSLAALHGVNFSSAGLYSVNFSPSLLEAVNFSSAKLFNVNFSSAKLGDVNFSSATLGNVNFSSARFRSWSGVVRFDHAKLQYAVFDKCLFGETDFRYANLEGSSFRGASIGTSDFSHANLEDADLTNTTITDNQLHSALSIWYAKLPNGTLGQGRNLVRNGDAHCNISLLDHWRIRNGSIAVRTLKENPNHCRFSLESPASGATMSQRIDLAAIWDSSFWKPTSIELYAQMSSGASIELIGQGKEGEVFVKEILKSTNNNIKMFVEDNIQALDVVVTFNPQANQSGMESSWCDNIELFVNYKMYP